MKISKLDVFQGERIGGNRRLKCISTVSSTSCRILRKEPPLPRRLLFRGTDPTQSASRLELELTARAADLTASDQTPVPAGKRAVYFRSVPGRYYGAESAADLGDTWTLQVVRIATTTQTRFVLPAGGLEVFYRVLALP